MLGRSTENRCTARWRQLAGAVLIALAGMMSVDAFAVTCSSGPTPGSLSFALPNGSYSVPRNTPVGTRITPWSGFSRTYSHVWYCVPPAGNTINSGPAYRATLTPTGQTYSESGQTFTVFQTNLVGVGLVIGVASQFTWSGADNWGDVYYSGYPNGVALGNASWASMGSETSSGASYWFGASLTFAFVKTGPITAGTVSMPGTIGQVGMDDRPIASPMLIATLSTTGNPTFTEVACATPPVNVNLGTQSTSKFSGAGSTTVAIPFSIKLNSCPAGINTVSYEIDASTTIVNAPNSVVALDGGSTASGVGVQLLNGSGTPMTLGSPVVLTSYNPAGGSFSIPLQARYYQTSASPVTAGSANTSMTFTMTYQ